MIVQNIKVSIIVPVYNVADYLRRCLDSCVNQTLQEIEIIVVNDCSPDPRDGEIMKEYEQKFQNKVRCIWHKENLKLGGARNTGIRAACGEFVYCVDSDDYIDLKLCEIMYNAIVSEDADMAVCDFNRVENKIVIKNWMSNGNFNTSDLCERIKNIKMHSASMIMIKKIVIENNNLYFPNHNGLEDAMCSLWYLASKKIVRINEALYFYIIRENSMCQGEKRKTSIFNIQSIKYILRHDYSNNLDINAKKALFLYLIKYIPFWSYIMCVNYAAEFVKFCNDILDLFKIFKVDYNDSLYMQSEEDIFSREIFRFIEQNIDASDFNLEFAAYYQYQCKIMQLRKMRRLISLYSNKRLTLWGAEDFGKETAANLSILDIKFEITDDDPKTHGEKVLANVIVKPWDLVKNNTDVVLVSEVRLFDYIHEKLAKENPNIDVVDATK
jgi:glycosyltransferase involved in cell wall biosynthesis